jgi:hypothetical protein
MALVLLALGIGMVLGRRMQPLRYRHLGAPRVHWWPALALGVVLAIVADRLDGTAAVGVGIAGESLLVIGVLANLHLVGTGVVAVGLGLNLLSMVVDGGVPVRPGALVEAGVLDPGEVAGAKVAGPRHIEDDRDIVPWLGDALPVSPLGTVMSFGDLIVGVGIADVTAHAVRPRRRRAAAPPAPPPPDEPVLVDDDLVDELLLDLQEPVAITIDSPVHDWGTAPPAAPVSGTHHSARPDVMAPLVVGPATVVMPARQSR